MSEKPKIEKNNKLYSNLFLIAGFLYFGLAFEQGKSSGFRKFFYYTLIIIDLMLLAVININFLYNKLMALLNYFRGKKEIKQEKRDLVQDFIE